IPVGWLILAPTKADGALVTSSPLSFGSIHQVVLAWDHLDAFSDHIYRVWIGNSLLYSFSATAIVLATAIPAGYGLALGNFPGRRVALPLAKPIVALVFFFSFVADWNNFFLPYAVLADSSQYPIQVGLSNLLSSTPSFNPAQGGGGQQVNIFRPELALATLLAVIPV